MKQYKLTIYKNLIELQITFMKKKYYFDYKILKIGIEKKVRKV